MKTSIVFILLLTACAIVLDEDISQEELILLSPGDSISTKTDSISFWWQRLDGAYEYEFRLVSPTFDEALHVYADSITPENTLSLQLEAGDFQWAVRAKNGGYATDFFSRTFTILPDTTKGSE